MGRRLISDDGTIDPDQVNLIKSLLWPDERLLWVGRPVASYGPGVACFLFSQFLISLRFSKVIDQVWGWMHGDPIDSVPWYVIWYLASLFLGAYGIYRAWHAKATIFALTDMRALYANRQMGRRVHALTLQPESRVIVAPLLSGRADVMIEDKRSRATVAIANPDKRIKPASVIIFNNLTHADYVEMLANEAIGHLEQDGRYHDRFYSNPYVVAR